ncbi:MAG: hypothetical protein JSU07_12310 [Bacteroidetes bacterium]|nr:hypothetical protein [Bacteroidota bacterium]
MLDKFQNKTILIAPIDWGLGHAARCIPIINLLSKKNNLIVAYTKNNELFFKKEIAQLNLHIKLVELSSYNIRYSKILPAWLKIMLNPLKFFISVRRENKSVLNIVEQHAIDVIISDCRFGVRHKNCDNYIITHQLSIQVPLFKTFVNIINHHYLKKFNEIWVPDEQEKNMRLSGKLSQTKTRNLTVKYIGTLSRFNIIEFDTNPTIDYLVLISGVEPQRTLFEKNIVSLFNNHNKTVTLIRGTEKSSTIKNSNCSFINLATTNEIMQLIKQSKKIICRSGYSTLMDLHAMHFNKKNIILVPTPGQPEQEYLAAHWKSIFGTRIIKQENIFSLML